MHTAASPTPRPQTLRQPATTRPPIPDGLITDLARFITSAARTTSIEAGIAGALTFIAGLAGANYEFEDAGLATFIAQPAEEGRSAAAAGLARLAAAIHHAGCDIDAYQAPAQLDAPVTTLSHLATVSPVAYAIMEDGLFGAIRAPEGQGYIAQMRRVAVRLWDTAGQGRIPKYLFGFADPVEDAIPRPSYAALLLGVPADLKLTRDELHTDGFYARLLVIPPGEVVENRRAQQLPAPDLLQRVVAFARAQQAMARGAQQEVYADATAARRLGAFRREAGEHTKALGEIERTAWRHAVQQAQRVAATCAVARDSFTPTITGQDVDFACALARASAEFVIANTGAADTARTGLWEQQDQAVWRLTARWFRQSTQRTIAKIAPDKIQAMHANRVVPMQWFRTRSNIAPFRHDPAGAYLALTRSVERLVKAGILEPVSRRQTLSWAGTTAELYYWRGPPFDDA